MIDVKTDIIRAGLKAAGATLRSKKGSTLINVLSYLLPWRSWFLRTWTTIGRTIYAPTHVDIAGPLHPYATTIAHELVHVAQWRRFWAFLWLGYILLPLPVLFAWCRWAAEREAYLVDIRAGRSVDDVVNTLWRSYGWPWPKPLMRRWFVKELSK